MRKYSMLDLIRFRKFADGLDNNIKPTELIKAYNEKYPELSDAEKLKNIVTFFKENKIDLTGTTENVTANINAFLPSLEQRYDELSVRHDKALTALKRIYDASEHFPKEITQYKLAQNYAEDTINSETELDPDWIERHINRIKELQTKNKS